jgi:hypothetical protein
MSAKLAEKLTEIGEQMAALGESFTELSALYDAAGAKSGKSSGDGAAGKVSGRKGSSKVESEDDDELPASKPAAGKKTTSKKAKKVTEDDVRAMAKKVIDKHGKEKVTEILGGKLADVDEDDYAEKLAELEEALAEDDDDV